VVGIPYCVLRVMLTPKNRVFSLKPGVSCKKSLLKSWVVLLFRKKLGFSESEYVSIVSDFFGGGQVKRCLFFYQKRRHARAVFDKKMGFPILRTFF
jgi:hypothetical protein